MSKGSIVLVYSGGLDTSVCIPMVREIYDYDHVITVTVNVGQPEDDIRTAEEKARALGTEHYTVDAREEFAAKYVFPTLMANGDYEGYPLSTSIARPLIAARAVEVARRLGVAAFGHGCTGKGNDQFRIEFTLRTLMPEAEIVAPMREHNMIRSEEIEYARAHGVPVGATIDKIWSIDENLWGRSIEGGRLEDPDYTPPEEIFQWTSSPQAAPDEPEAVSIEFRQGIPIAVNGHPMSAVALIQECHRLAGKHGVGRIDVMEDRMLGLKVRENYECPGAVLLLTAHRALEALTLTQRELKFKAAVDGEWAELAYAGLWFDPLKYDLDAFIGATQRRVTGIVRLKLYKGGLHVEGRKSEWALYSEDLASFDSKTFDQRDSTGIVKSHGLQARMYAARMVAALASGADPSALPPGAAEIAMDSLPHGEA